MTQPKLFPVPFANGGDKNDILTVRVTGDVSQKVNLTEGFPPVTEQPKSAGGKAPLRKDFNGVLFHLTDNARYLQTGVTYHFDSSFASDIGGYPKGAILLSNDGATRYVSLVDGNTSNFNVSVDPLKWAKTSMTEAQVKAAHGCVRFVSDGSFTVPGGVYDLFVSASAGGGGGGGGAGSSGTTTGVGGGGGGGAGAGQSAVKVHLAVTPGQVIPITVGAGGIAGIGATSAGLSTGTNGGNGGATAIGSLLSLAGGIGGDQGGWLTRDALPSGGGSGGFGGAGYPEGADGVDGNYTGGGGSGASSPFGGGGASGRAGTGGGAGTSTGGFAGTDGKGFGTGGGGGGGSYGTWSGNGGNGGAGAPGIAIIEW